MVLVRDPHGATSLAGQRKEAPNRGQRERFVMTPKIKEHTCTTCNGTGFPTVKQPMLATHKIYPVKCTVCAGKGRIADSTD
jgi:DnaJ-class molecular chaperone